LKGRTFRCAVKAVYFCYYEAASAAEVVAPRVSSAGKVGFLSTGGYTRLNMLLKNSEKQIPHRLKPVRDDKYKGLATAQLKLRPFEIGSGRVFRQSVKACSTLDSAMVKLV
jgi:hypothetical protein